MTISSVSKLNCSNVDRLPKFFDLDQEIRNVAESKLLQLQVDLFHQNKKMSKFREEILEFFSCSEGKIIVENMFWQVFVNNFSNWIAKKQITLALHIKISSSYNKLYASIPKSRKDYVMDALTVLFGIQIYKLFTGIFKADLKQFNSRFLIDCIHFVV